MTDRTLTHLSAALLLSAVVACGGSSSTSSDVDGDGILNAADVLPGYTLVVAAADFTSPEGRIFAATPAITIGPDPISTDVALRAHGGLVYAINRFGADNVQVLDPAAGLDTIAQFSTGNGSNPHDLVVVGNHAYVTRNQEASLLIVDPRDGTELGSIDLSPLADADDLPEMDQMAVVGSTLFVTLQRLDQNAFFIPSGPGAVAVIDTAADAVIAAFELQGLNPSSRVESDGRYLYVATTGDFGVNDGGIERIDPADPTGSTTVVSGVDLGGDLSELAIAGPTKGYVVVAAFDFASGTSSSRVVAFNPTTGAVIGDVFANDAFLPDIRISPDGTLLAVADRTAATPGVLLLDTTSDQQVAGPIHDDSQLPPSSFVFVE
jgi:DNA-binding beta-propeller fold protein YncE